MRQTASRKQFLHEFVQWISANMIKMQQTRPSELSESFFYLIFLINAYFTGW